MACGISTLAASSRLPYPICTPEVVNFMWEAVPYAQRWCQVDVMWLDLQMALDGRSSVRRAVDEAIRLYSPSINIR